MVECWNAIQTFLKRISRRLHKKKMNFFVFQVVGEENQKHIGRREINEGTSILIVSDIPLFIYRFTC
jgi:hypothetical protein